MFEVIAGAVMLAFGLAAVYFSAESDLENEQFVIVLLLGIAAAIGGGYVLFTRLPLITLLTKAAGAVLAVVGFFLVINFPDVTDYQSEGMSKAGVFAGLVMLILGAYLVLFG